MLKLNFTPFPELTTRRLLLRQISEKDARNLFLLRSDQRVMEFIDRPLALSIQEVQAVIGRIREDEKNLDGITWAITLQEKPGLVGTIGFWQIKKEHFRAEIGYMLHPDWWGKGLMKEAMKEVIRYGFETMNLHSIEANVNPANRASIRLLEKNDFTREAYFRENFYFNGQFLDTVIYSRINHR